MALDIDSVFQQIGEFGRYQKFVYFLLCLPAIFVGVSNLAFVFIAARPDYRCVVPQCDLNLTHPTYQTDFLNFTIPADPKTGRYSECERYLRLGNLTNSACVSENFSTNETVECPEGKVFDKTVYKSTIVSEFNLTCSEEWESQAVQSIYFGGVLLGSLVCGLIADLIGRKATLIICVVSMAATGLITSLVTSFTAFNVMRFLNAAFSTGTFQAAFILGVELVGPSKRVLCGVINEYFYAFGEILLGLVAWWFRDWRMTQMVISVPVTGFIFYWRFVPESPRWLQSRDKHQKAAAVLEKIAKHNAKPISSETLNKFQEDTQTTTAAAKSVTILDILQTPWLCVRMFAMFYIWIVTTLLFYGLSLNMTELTNTGDPTATPYVNFILAALVEFPGYTLAWVGMTWWGRRSSLALSMILGGLACIAAGFTAEYSISLVMIPALIGKCCITCGFAIIFVFASEMFPTRVRGTVLGMCSMWARVGGMLAPFSENLSNIYGPLPLLVFGLLSLVAGAVNIVMPETLGTTLPDTVQEAVNLGRRSTVSNEEHRPLLENNSSENYGSEDTSTGTPEFPEGARHRHNNTPQHIP